MSKKNIITVIAFLVLGVVTTYIATIAEIFMSGKVLSGTSGFPFRYGSSSFFGGSEINQMMFLLDVIFWAVILLGIWSLIKKATSKSK